MSFYCSSESISTSGTDNLLFLVQRECKPLYGLSAVHRYNETEFVNCQKNVLKLPLDTTFLRNSVKFCAVDGDLIRYFPTKSFAFF